MSFETNETIVKNLKIRITSLEEEIEGLQSKLISEKHNHEKEIIMLNDHLSINNTTIDENNKLISILQKQIQKFNKQETESVTTPINKGSFSIDKDNLFISPYECLLNNEIKAKEGQIMSLQGIVDRLRRSETEEQETIVRLRGEIEDFKRMEEEFTQMKTQLSDKDKCIAQLKTQIQDLYLDIDDLKEQRNLYKKQFMEVVQKL
ncbi:hypothetical protein WA158_000633 [Blastocystis sp. Blastoise]